MQLIQNILLVDDDDVNNYINARLLNKLTYTDQVNIVLNGEEALNFVKARADQNQPLPDLIFLDINMPVMDGFEFLKHYATLDFKGQNPVLIMLTTSSNEQDVSQISTQPIVAGYLNKPLTENKMDDIMEKHFLHKSAS